ncbi:MAG TPA: dethiobiotin synthase [Flavitalea sp.]|nr:dethiobiotin synthase [Flavitalea sp.]
MKPIFITGIGTGIGKTVVSAIVATALDADYWKPVQAGTGVQTDSQWVSSILSPEKVWDETYRLKMAASPHIAARDEGVSINVERIQQQLSVKNKKVVIEGAGGLLVPLTDKLFIIDLIKRLDARVILVSRNYLGSINHSLLTAKVCADEKLDVVGWIFNDQYLNYEEEIVNWTKLAKIASIPRTQAVTQTFIKEQANRCRSHLLKVLC